MTESFQPVQLDFDTLANHVQVVGREGDDLILRVPAEHVELTFDTLEGADL